LTFGPAADDLAGYVMTIEEIAVRMKCRLALEFIAPRYVRRLNTPWLSNPLGDGISKAGQSAFRCSQRPVGGRHHHP